MPTPDSAQRNKRATRASSKRPGERPRAAVGTDFLAWAERYLAASPEEKQPLEVEGAKVAEARRPLFKQLIKDDPKAALENAVPMVVRQKLPASILAFLETRVNGVGTLRVYQGTPMPDEPLPKGSLTIRKAEMKDGKTYQAYVYGRRTESQKWVPGASLNGVAMDADFAVNEEPSRTLEVGEAPPADKPAVTVCPVSGKQALTADETVAEISEETPAIETATETVYFCSDVHINTYNQTLIMGEGVSGGAMGFTGILPSAPTPALGVVKVLVIPMSYADQNGVPSTEAALYAMLRDVGEFYSKASFGRLTLVGTVTPPVKLPHNEAWYINRDTSNGGDIDGEGLEHSHARDEARKLGYDSNNYDCVGVRHNGGPGSYGGLGGGSSVWARSDGMTLWAHEIGHCFALAHANFWDTAGTSAIGSGANAEYGDIYDIMGSGGTTAHYNAQAKNQIKWLPSSYVQNVTQSGRYRIYAFDQGTLDPARRYAMTIAKDAQKTYWGEVRSLFDVSYPWVKSGMLLGWRYPNGSGSNIQLIDTTPGSPYSKDDAAVSLGSTFSDTESGVHLTTVGFNDSPRYIEVQANFGQFPGNQRPTLSLAASADVVPTGATVTFTATASDPDGDALAYSWQNFGDTSVRVVSPNSPAITRTFSSAGTYVVSCTASDMKGGTATRNQLITVGNGNSRFTISGRVALLGQGLQNVVVTANGANGVITDADGWYTIPNLAANTYTMAPLLYGYSFGELFNNSVTVGPNFTGADFEATASSIVTITASTPDANEKSPVTPGRFTLTRTGDTSQDLVVNVNTAQGSATKGADYNFLPDYVAASQGFSNFTIPADSETLDIAVTPLTDTTVEGPETVILQLGPGNGYLVGPQSTAAVTIADDDALLADGATPKPKVSIVATNPDTIEGSAQPAVLTVSRTGATTTALTVNYTVSGTAADGADYTTLTSSVVIPVGAASTAVNVSTINDSSSESIETVKLTLSTDSNYVIDSLASTATANITDDDSQVVSVTAPDATAQEVDLTQPGAIANTGTFLVTRTGDTTHPLTVYYAFAGTSGSGVTALHGVDYEAMPGSVVIPAGQTQATVTIVPRYDGFGEGPESVLLVLGTSAAGNYVLGSPGNATVTINDASADLPYLDVVNTGSASEPSTSGIFRITARGNTAPLLVNYTITGTATNGTDYDAGDNIWISKTSGTTTTLNAVWSSDASNVWAVGGSGTVLKWNGTAWGAQTSGTTNALRGVWGSDASNVWAVGDSGTILKWNGTAWSAQPSGTTNALRSVWGSSATSVWAVGDGGTALKYNGTAWSAQTSGTTNALRGVWGADASNVWAAGDAGTIIKFNGTAWSAQTSGVSTALNAVWGSSSTNLWAAGAGGVIRKGTGTSWSSQSSNTTSDLNAIHGADASNLWAVGANGTLLRTTNGSTWAVQISNTIAALNGVRSLGASSVWAAGDSGAIMNWNTAASIALPGTLVIPPGTSTVDLTVRPIDDALAEDLENVTLTLNASAAYQTFAPTNSATMWLRDNERPTVYVDTQVGTSGSSTVTEGTTSNPTKFYVSRTGSTTSALAVNFTFGGTTAASGASADYAVTTSATLAFDAATATGTLTIPAGSLGADIPITITNDTTFEGTETITFDFAAGAYARSTGTVMYVADNDTATNTVSFQSPGSSGLESVTAANIPVQLSASPTSPVTVEYAVSGNTNPGTNSTASTHPLPYWVRLVKTGDSIAHFESNDGANWTQRGSSFTVTGLGSTSYLAGIGVASGSATATTATIDNFTIAALSAGGTTGAETSANIGNATGGTSPSVSGVYSFNTPGNGIATSSTADNFRFVYLPVSNSADCTVTARLVSIGTTNTSARLGVMLRSSTVQGSVYAASLATGAATSLFYTMNRTALNAASNAPTTLSAPVLPQWFKLVRAGDSFTSSYSKDGATWTALGASQTLAMGPQSLVGLAVSAASDGSIATATFENVSLTGVAAGALQGRTVGFVNEQGSEGFDSGSSTWTVNGSGAGIANNSDEAHFVAAEVSGDFTLIGRVTSLTGGGSGAQAGAMIRQTRDGYSRMMHVGYVKSGSMERRHRAQSVTNAVGSGVDFTLPSGVLTFAAGETLKNITLNVTDDNIPEPDDLITIQLLNANGAAVSSTANYHGYTIIDDDGAAASPWVAFAAASSTVAESAGTTNLLVTLSAPASGPVSVDYSVTSGSATNGSDYTLSNGTLSFAAGESVKSIPIAVTDDPDVESGETVIVTLASPVAAQLGGLSSHTLTITDNDLPVVSIVANDPNAAEQGLDPGQVTVSRTGPTAAVLTVSLNRSGSAASGTDYTAIASPLSLVIPIGQSSATLNVTPVDDSTNEGSETVIETIASSASYTIGAPSNATVTIADNDRSTVTLAANDPIASETAGNAGQFTITRTAPTNVALTVNLLAVSGTATSGTDYTTNPSTVASIGFAIGDASKTITITPIDDSATEGDEQVTLQLTTGSYDIGTPSYDNVTIQDNDNAPVLFINSPGQQGTLIANGNGVIVSATVTDDGAPQAVTQTWSQVSGPGTATIESPDATTTAATFSAPGNYVLRITATDGQFTVSDQVTVVVGSALVAANWITQDLGPSSARRGQGLDYAGQFTVTGTGAGYLNTPTDQAHVLVRQVSGDGSIVARLTDPPTTGALSGVTIRDSMARGARRAVLGLVPGTGLQFIARTAVSTSQTTAAATQAGLSLPLWLKLERNATTGDVIASYAPDVSGTAGAWTQLGATTNIAMDSLAEFGLTTTNNSTAGTATGVFDNVTLTPAPSGPALLSEDSGASPAAAGSGSLAGSTYTVVGSTSGYYHGWQYYGDMVVTARLVTFTSGAGSAIGGIRVAESMESGAYAHMGRIPTGAYSGYVWTSIAGGSSGGVPSGVGAGNWIRIVRKGNSITGFRASDVSGAPGTWTQIGQPQTVIMTTPLFVGFYVNNASGVGLNTCTFNGLTVVPLNKAPIVDAVASANVAPVTLDGAVTDDHYPAPVSLTTQWTKLSGPAGFTFANASLIDTTATLTTDGSYALRLYADDGSAQSFKDLLFNGYTSAFAAWQGSQFTGGSSNPSAAMLLDPDNDGTNNLLEYALGSDPKISAPSNIVQDTTTLASQRYLRISLAKNTAATDVTYEVQATSDLKNPASWSSAGLVIETNTASQLVVRDNVAMSSGVRRFMRVLVSHP